jgi:hypothetical protein
VPFATGLDDPRGLVGWKDWLFVADRKRVWRIDRKGKVSVFAAAAAFPTPPRSLADVAADEQGTLRGVPQAEVDGLEAGQLPGDHGATAASGADPRQGRE